MSVCVPMGPVKGKDVDQADLRLRLSASLEEARSELIDATERGEGGRAALARHAECIDGIIRALVENARTQTQTSLGVCAVGGYGRKSQFLHSDIDLLVVFGGSIGRPEERFVKALLHPLWDLRFQVGHHVRELGEFDRLDTTNPEYLLALMDLRPLAGDRDLTDTPLTIARGAPEVRGLQVVISSKGAKVSGEVVDLQGRPAPDATVIVFAEDRARWTLSSRFIKAVRPDNAGRFSVGGLPPGTYRAIAREAVVAGQWEDAEFLSGLVKDAARVALAEGASETVKLVTGPPR